MKTTLKVIGRFPRSKTDVTLSGKVTQPGKVLTNAATLLSDYFAASVRDKWPESKAADLPKPRRITITFTLP